MTETELSLVAALADFDKIQQLKQDASELRQRAEKFPDIDPIALSNNPIYGAAQVLGSLLCESVLHRRADRKEQRAWEIQLPYMEFIEADY